MRRICFALAFCEIVKLLLSIILFGIITFFRSILTVAQSIITFLRSTIDPSPQICVVVVSAISIATIALRLAIWNTDINSYPIQHFRKVINTIFACDLVLCLSALFFLLITRDTGKTSCLNSIKNSDNSRYLY